MKREEGNPPSSATPHLDGERRRRRPSEPVSPEAVLARLHTAQAAHPFWQNRLFKACSAGSLTRDDFKLVFAQYYLYSQNFTRYLAALMASCESDLLRARLAENIWEEG